jgi:hypothetical protein
VEGATTENWRARGAKRRKKVVKASKTTTEAPGNQFCFRGEFPETFPLHSLEGRRGGTILTTSFALKVPNVSMLLAIYMFLQELTFVFSPLQTQIILFISFLVNF